MLQKQPNTCGLAGPGKVGFTSHRCIGNVDEVWQPMVHVFVEVLDKQPARIVHARMDVLVHLLLQSPERRLDSGQCGDTAQLVLLLDKPLRSRFGKILGATGGALPHDPCESDSRPLTRLPLCGLPL